VEGEHIKILSVRKKKLYQWKEEMALRYQIRSP
jgi:hypothetical protein